MISLCGGQSLAAHCTVCLMCISKYNNLYVDKPCCSMYCKHIKVLSKEWNVLYKEYVVELLVCKILHCSNVRHSRLFLHHNKLQQHTQHYSCKPYTYRINKLHVETITQLFDPVGDFIKMNFLSSSICQQILTTIDH